MHSKKFGYIAIGIFLFAVGVFFSALYLQIQTKKKIYKHGLSTVGVLFDVKGDYIKVKYTVDGDTLTFGTTRPYRHLQNGEEYIVKYMEEDPEYISVLYSQPFFSDSHQYGIVNCSSLSKNQSLITYEYFVGDTRIVRQTKFKSGNSLHKDDYKVKYRIDDPKIGYLVTKDG